MVLEPQVKTAVAGKAARIGVVTDRNPLLLVLRTVVGTHRLSDFLSGKHLPRIC